MLQTHWNLHHAITLRLYASPSLTSSENWVLDSVLQAEYAAVSSKSENASAFYQGMVLPSSNVRIRRKASTQRANSASVIAIMSDDKSLPWAIDGANVIAYLTSVDPAQVGIGSVLCRPSDLVPLSSCFTARVIIFDIDIPITVGASVCISPCVLPRRLSCP